jgi:heat shock protein HtpX
MMWELIRANRRRSLILMGIMLVSLLGLGYLVGRAVDPDGGWFGLALAAGVYVLLATTSFAGGDRLLLASVGAKEITEAMHPKLFHVVEEMKIAAGLPAMPRVYIVEDPSPNAFAVGLKPERSAVAVTTGLLSRLNRDELQGVVAHEVSHIANRDSQFMTLAGVMLGSIVMLSEIFLRYLWFAPRSRRSRVDGKGGGQAQLLIFLAAIAAAVLAPILAQLLYLAISRRREYLADASAARLTRYPQGLASALKKIATSGVAPERSSRALAPLYIADPKSLVSGKLDAWTSTHPPIEERIRILEAMSGGASLVDYQRAFAKVRGKAEPMLPRSALKQDEKVAIRPPSEEPEPVGSREGLREAMDALRAAAGYAFLVCRCGLKIKIPPRYTKPTLRCPRCGIEHVVPFAAAREALASLGRTGDGKAPEEKHSEGAAKGESPQVYRRRGTGWESFACRCGQHIQLSPAFRGTRVTCRSCGRSIRVESAS